MEIVKFARRGALFLSMLVILAACGGGGGGGAGDGTAGEDGVTTAPDTTGGADNAKAEFTLTAFDREGLQTGGLLGLSQLTRLLGGTQLTRVSGAILTVAQATGQVSESQYALDIDASGFSIPTEVQMDLPPGQYDFYFLMSASNGRQYAGISKNWSIMPVDAEAGERNIVSFLVHPVIGENIPDAETLRSLAEFQFGFGDLAINQWNDPTFGIEVDGGGESRYSINAATGFSQAFVYLPAGQYTFEVRFYDGQELVVIPIVIVVDITQDGGSVDVDVVPIDIVNNVTPDESGSVMNLVISGKAIDDAGGPSNVSATFSLRDDESLLFEQALVLSKVVGGNYEATVDVQGLQPGFMTWAVQMQNAQGGVVTPYAWCAQTIQLAAGAQTLICTLRVADETPAWMRVIARTTNGIAVEGAIVIANGEPIGITGSGDGGTIPGELKIFLPEGTYEVVALHPLSQPAAQQVTLTDGQTVDAEFQFIPDDQTAPVVRIAAPVGNTNNPSPVLLYTIDESPVQVTVRLASGSQAAEEIGTRNGEPLGSLADGSYTVTVSAVDQAGNEGSNSATFTVDSTAPGLSIISPVNGSLINTAAPNLVLLSGDTGTVIVQIDGGAETDIGVTAGVQKSTPLSSLSDGPHSIEAYQEDGFGNPSSALTEFTVDTHAPLVEIVSPPGETEDHEPLLEYTTSETGSEAVFVDGQPVKTRSGDYLPWLADGSHTVKVEIADLAGNKGSDTVDVEIVSPPPIQAFELDAFYYKRPRERVDDKVFVEGKVKVRIPDQSAIQVITGNPERYLLYLRLGEVHCLYLGGGANAHFGGLEWRDVEWFRQFKSPVCGLGRYRAGDEVTVEKSIYMRILFADPRFDETHLKVFLDITGEGEVSEDDGHRRRHYWRWWRHDDRREEWRTEDDGKWWFDRGRWRDDDRDDDDGDDRDDD